MNSEYFTANKTLGSWEVTEERAVLLGRRSPKIYWLPCWQIQWWNRQLNLYIFWLPCFYFRHWSVWEAAKYAAPEALTCSILPPEVSEIKLILVLIIRKSDIEVQQRPLDGFLFNNFNKQSRYRIKKKNETTVFPLH